MRWDDIPSILAIARETSSCWLGPDFRSVLQSHETLGYVGEIARRVVGFALCTVHRDALRRDGIAPRPISSMRESLGRWMEWVALMLGKSKRSTRRIHLFSLVVARDYLESGLERQLLKRIDTDLRDPTDRLDAIVPETHVFAQAMLREAGFLAVRVLTGYYLEMDGYLMARDNGTFLAPTVSADVNAPNAS